MKKNSIAVSNNEPRAFTPGEGPQNNSIRGDMMRLNMISGIFGALFLAAFLTFSQGAAAEERKQFVPDKAQCAKMLQFGKQAYMRGKYLDAKGYFRRAVQADPQSALAWQYYDLASVFALAEKVEQDKKLIAPGASTRQEGGTLKAAPKPPTPPPAPAKKAGKEEEEEEGC